MADLSQLSDEQLSVYRDLLAQKQGVPGMEKLGGQPPAAGAKPAPPEALQGPAPSIGQRALENLPLSVALLPGKFAKIPTLPFGTQQDQGTPDLLGDVKNAGRGLVNAIQHPGETFANDPAGTIATLGLLGQGIYRGAEALPSMARAGKNFETVMRAAGSVPIDLTEPGNIALRANEFAGRGTTLPKVFRDFTNAATKPGAAPLTYREGRDFASNAGRLSAQENLTMTPTMKRQVAAFSRAMDQANADAATRAGVGPLYTDAMREYRNAARLRSATATAKDIAKTTAGKAALVGLGGGAGYYAARKLIEP